MLMCKTGLIKLLVLLDQYGKNFSLINASVLEQNWCYMKGWSCQFFSMEVKVGAWQKSCITNCASFMQGVYGPCAGWRAGTLGSTAFPQDFRDLLTRVGLSPIDSYIIRRQLQWAGHFWRMPFNRLPHKMLTCWVPSRRPHGCPQFMYGRGLYKALKRLDIDKESWTALASESNFNF